MDRNQNAKRNEFVPLAKLKTYKLKNYNFRLCIFLLALSILGVVIVGSASSRNGIVVRSAIYKQLIGVTAGIIGMVIISLIDYNWICKFSWVIYLLNIALLVFVLIKGRTINNATRWIAIGSDDSSLTIQPSEFAKIFLIIFWSKFLTTFKDKVSKWWFIILFLIVSAIPLALIVKEPDLSTTLLISSIMIIAIYTCGLSYKKIALILAIVIPLAAVAVIYIQQPDQKLLKKYQKNRVLSFIYPDEYDELRYQQDNSVLAIGSGKLNGKGLYNDNTDSLKNANYLSREVVNDFIFAVIGEETGFVGSCTVLILLLLIIAECFIAAIFAPDITGRLICTCIGMLLTVQTFINVGVATEILPNTGIPLPFISSGLSSLISLYGGMGFVLNVSLQKVKQQVSGDKIF